MGSSPPIPATICNISNITWGLRDVCSNQIFRRIIFGYRDFFHETKFFDTDTETFFSETKFFDTNTETPQKIVMGLKTETENKTFAYDWQILGTSRDKF